jgi:hypothetical protein
VTDINSLAKDIEKEMKKYSRLVSEEFEEAKDDVSNSLVSELKRESPERRPKYKKGWARKKTKKGYIIHNKTNYQLTHLLEHGHARRNGGREVPAQVHIRPAEEKAIDDFLDKTEKAIKK